MTSGSTYAALEAHFKKLSNLGHVSAILGWDEAAMMPVGGGEARGQAMATLGGVIHELMTDPALGELLEQCPADGLDPWQRANLRQMRRDYRQATCLPADLVERFTLATSRCEQAWRTLRPANDWAGLQPLLEEVVALSRERAAALADVSGLGLYDALLDEFEPGMSSARVTELFEGLKLFLPGAIDAALERQADMPAALPGGRFSIEDQRKLAARVMQTMGFDFEHGRLDVSHHPFCGGVPDDVRLTTRYSEDDFLKALMGVIHETGHALYEQGLPQEWRHQPVGEALSMATHESQSLLMEMQACRTPEFIGCLAPILQRQFLGEVSDDPDWSADNLHRLFTRVERGYIRVDADELTYPMHVVLRFEIERDLMEGKIEVGDLPGLWDAKMQAYLGLDTAGNYTDGVMQDVHWPSGGFGYFPTYSLGAMTAAQLFRAAKQAQPEILTNIGQGNFAPLLGWLRTHVHGRGRLLSFDELLREATGEALNVAHFEAHLRERYLG